MHKIKTLLAKAKHSVRTITIISSAAALVIVGSGLFVTRHVATQHAVAQQKQSQAATDKALRQASITEAQVQATHKAQAAQNASKPADTANKVDADHPAAKPGQIKYSTSSDPRSTAYSLTPPAENPASFNYKVTHAGQFAAGTLISYNANKGDRLYYGGDLLINPSTVTVHRTAPYRGNVTITSPDGKVMGMAAMPWDDQNPNMFIAYDSASPTSGVSLPMFVQVYSTTPNGTYTLHIGSSPSNQSGSDLWVYDGFITVNVVD